MVCGAFASNCLDSYAAVATAVSVLNVVLLLGLLYLYGRIAAKTHAGYTYGLMIFSGLLLAQNSGMVYVCGLLTNLYDWQLSPYFAFVAVVEFAGLLALLRVTL
jgi:hypothetical protein